MKRMRYLSAAAALCLLLCSCGESTANSERTENSVPALQTSPVAESQADPIETRPPKMSAEQIAELGDYTWYREPFLEAEDINPFNAAPGAYNYGNVLEEGYSVITRGGKIGLIDSSGNILVEPEFCCTHNWMPEGERAHFLFTDSTSKEAEGLCYCTAGKTAVRTNGQYCPVCGSSIREEPTGMGCICDPEYSVPGGMDMSLVRKTEAGVELQLLHRLTMLPSDMPESVTARNMTIPRNYTETDKNAVGKMGEGFGIVRGMRIVAGLNYENGTDFKEGIAAFLKDGRWGYLNEAGRMVLPFAYDGDMVYDYGESRCREEDPDTSGDVTLPYLPTEGYLALNTGGQGGYYNMDASSVVVPVGTFANVRPVVNGLAWVQDRSSSLWGIIAFGGNHGAPQIMDETQQVVEANGNDWTYAYAAVLRQYDNNEQVRFTLCDLNTDGTPELVLHWFDDYGFVPENNEVEMFTYYNGVAVNLGNVCCDGYGTCKYFPQHNMMLFGGAIGETVAYEFRRLEDGAFVGVRSFGMNVVNGEPSYVLDGNPCSKEEYIRLWQELYTDDVIYDAGTYTCTEDNITAILNVPRNDQAG